ncbi:hypothetical protein GGI12_004857 [Dipsacomyces acuminosporus]|nr:hypothetical protein GGI12_004857 [Dipsacomyces acuminosporus]
MAAQAGVAKTEVSWLDYSNQLLEIAEQIGYTRILAAGASVYAAYKIIYALFLSPYRRIPGPFLSRISRKPAELTGMAGAQARKALEDYEKYGDIYMYEPSAVAISNPDDIRRVLSSHDYVKSKVYKGLDLLGVENTTSTRDPHLSLVRRRQIGPYFSNMYLARMESAILDHGIISIKEKWDGLLKASGSGQAEVNYHNHFLNTAFDIIGSLSFGKAFGSLKNDDQKIAEWKKATTTYLGVRTMFPLFRLFPFSLALSSLKPIYDDFANYAVKCVADRRKLLAELELNGELHKRPVDLLQGLIDCQDPESKMKMSPIEIQAETLLMLLVGTDTTSNTLMWTVHLFMLYPKCYTRVVEEVRNAFDKAHLIRHGEAKAKLPYLEACLYESMRLAASTGGAWPRVAPKQGVELGGHFLPGGTDIYINISGANYNRKYWNDPHRFNPDRFLDNEEAKRNVLTFGAGVRVCLGKQLAWIEMLTILANVLKDYDFRLPADYTVCGPNVLSDKGYPRLMDTIYFGAVVPSNPERDCRIVITKA